MNYNLLLEYLLSGEVWTSYVSHQSQSGDVGDLVTLLSAGHATLARVLKTHTRKQPTVLTDNELHLNNKDHKAELRFIVGF